MDALNPSLAFEQVADIVNSLFALLPNLVIGLLVVAIFYFLATLAKRLVVGAIERAGLSDNAGIVFGRLIRYVVLFVGIFLALTILIPDLSASAFVGALGFGSVAIGFAFRDILQNFLAGLLLLITEPFDIGDQIVVDGFEGTVQSIETRATRLRTYDGREVVIPNGTLFTTAVVVNTANPLRRSQYDVGIGYGDDLEEARQEMLGVLRSTEGVVSDPAPEVLVVELADSTVNLRGRWWTDSTRADVVHVKDRVLAGVKKTLTEKGIDMPFPTSVLLFHDQTEETDGDRRRQREGWPAGKGENPRPLAEVLRQERSGGGSKSG